MLWTRWAWMPWWEWQFIQEQSATSNHRTGQTADCRDQLFLSSVESGDPKRVRCPAYLMKAGSLHAREHLLRRRKLLHGGGKVFIRSAHAGKEGADSRKN